MNSSKIDRVFKFLRRRPPKGRPSARENDQFHILVEQSSDGILVTNANWTLLDVNSSVCLMFGYDRKELQRRAFGELIAGEDLPKLELIDKALRTGDSVLCSLKCRRRGGAAFPAEVNLKPLLDGRIQVILRDMTQKGKMRALLEASEARYRAIVEDQTEFIRRFKPDLTLTYVNPAFCRYFRKSQLELLGKNFLEPIPEEDHELELRQIRELSLARPVAAAERRARLPDGEIRWQQWVNRAIFDDDGEIIEYQSVGRDITAQKEAESKVQEAREAIERAARVTTLAVIGGGIAHEINQPLNAIKILVGTIAYLAKTAEHQLPAIISENVADIAVQVDRIDSIVNHLRLFLRNSQTFQYCPCDLNAIVETALTLVANQLFSKRIRVKKLFAPALPPVCGSSVRFEEVVLNLIMNAVDALEAIEDRRLITIQTWAEKENVHLAISDNGHGVAPEVAEKLFEPFFSTKKQGFNMGLGLSIVHSIVVSSNGAIRVENLPSGGTLFTISLPASETGACGDSNGRTGPAPESP